VVRVIWHKAASPPQMDGSVVFARWRQCALPWGHTGATWRIWSNLCFLLPVRVHNANGKLLGSAIFAHSRHCHRACPSMSFSLIIAPSHRGSGPHVIHAFFGPPESITQTASRFVQPFLHRWLQSVPIPYIGTPVHPSQFPLSNTWFLGPPKSSVQTTSRSVSRFCRAH